jgi:two-component sensor histidine kinase/CheY-like chemotaxis protein
MDRPGQKTILLVEDELLIAAVESQTIEGFGYSVLIAGSGEKAVDIGAANPDIDLILMDIDLGGGIDGTEAARRILAKRAVPIVFLTSHGEKEFVERVKEITRYGYVIKNSGDFVLRSSIEMALNLFEANQRESRSQRLLKEMSEIAKIGGWEFDAENKKVYWTEESYSIYDVEASFDPTIEKILEFYTPGSRKYLAGEIKRTMETGSSYDIEAAIITARGKRKWVRSIGKPVFKNGKITGRIGVTQDISERRAGEESFLQTQSLLEEMSRMAKVGAWKTDVASRRIEWTEQLYSIYELDPSISLDIDKLMDFYTPESRHLHLEGIRRTMETGEPFDLELEIVTPKGTEKWLNSKGKAVYTDGKITHRIGITQDITERKHAEKIILDNDKKILSLLEEKDLFLKEVQHRIKNNMSTMTSLLSLQAHETQDPAAFSVLKDAQNRFHSMAVLYDKLYRSESINEMPVESYLAPLVEDVVKIFPNRNSVKIEKKIDDFILGVKELSTLGIIVNELLTNIMKHAFTNNTLGIITVSAAKTGNRVRVSIADNGKGIPEAVGNDSPGGFGLLLVETLIKQLNGTLKIERNEGTRFTLEFEAVP